MATYRQRPKPSFPLWNWATAQPRCLKLKEDTVGRVKQQRRAPGVRDVEGGGVQLLSWSTHQDPREGGRGRVRGSRESPAHAALQARETAPPSLPALPGAFISWRSGSPAGTEERHPAPTRLGLSGAVVGTPFVSWGSSEAKSGTHRTGILRDLAPPTSSRMKRESNLQIVYLHNFAHQNGLARSRRS